MKVKDEDILSFRKEYWRQNIVGSGFYSAIVDHFWRGKKADEIETE